MKFAQGLGLALAFLHDVKSQIFIKSRIYLQPRLINGVERWIHPVQRLINGVQRLINGVQMLINGAKRLINEVQRLINEAKILILIKSKIFPQAISQYGSDKTKTLVETAIYRLSNPSIYRLSNSTILYN